MKLFDPVKLAQRQLELDRQRTARLSFAHERKVARMVRSPLSFLRGTAPLFYEMLSASPDLAEGPSGHGWLVGDAHLENFGAYRADHETVFDLNDFDDTLVGPVAWDALRLCTSLLLAGRELGVGGVACLGLVHALLKAHGAAYAGTTSGGNGKGGGKGASLPRPVESLVARVGGRGRGKLLDDRTERHGGHRRFVRGDRYRSLTEGPKGLEALVPAALEGFRGTFPGESDDAPSRAQLEVVDAALRIAGTGSLGCVRLAVLVRGKGDRDGDGGWVFDVKEQGTPSAADLLERLGAERSEMSPLTPAGRVVAGTRACQAKPMRHMAAVEVGGYSMVVRRLMPQEDHLALETLAREDLLPLASHLGTLLGAAHRRGATKRPRGPWGEEAVEGIIDRAIFLAGVHEATYLAYCRLAPRSS